MSEQPENPRTRTVTWKDPRVGASAAKTLSGLEYLRAIQRGELPAPPIAELMGFAPVEVEEGRVVFAVTAGEHHYNPIGMVHGGLAATLMDSAMGCAIHTLLPVGAGYTTLELHVNYVKGIAHDTGRLLCRGEVIHLGGRVATAQGRLVDEKGTLYAHGTTTCMVFRPPGAGGKE
ncbi:PaaI family thioesterase [Corallococcus macrosporus]|uniref:PaaI family thioesterase n=1 Tax=Corallococcus macrosporus TaxID=35 RepID=A0ABS3D8F0_9BACT|nr:PaaI family thioesterase [Corallococcus macrosporus]MBN8227217.1 PaaI family thioesterase [Corallococcus macrosporus]